MLRQTIKKVLKEEKKLIPYIRRRVNNNLLDRAFQDALKVAISNFYVQPGMTRFKFKGMTITNMIQILIFRLQDDNDNYPEDDIWKSLYDYYENQMDEIYEKIKVR